MTDELQAMTLTIEIEPTALTLLQQQADQQSVTLDQLAARSIGRAAAQAETHAGHIQAANAGARLVERNQPRRRPSALGHQYVLVLMVSLCRLFCLVLCGRSGLCSVPVRWGQRPGHLRTRHPGSAPTQSITHDGGAAPRQERDHHAIRSTAAFPGTLRSAPPLVARSAAAERVACDWSDRPLSTRAHPGPATLADFGQQLVPDRADLAGYAWGRVLQLVGQPGPPTLGTYLVAAEYGVLCNALAESLWVLGDEFLFPHHIPFPWWSDIFFLLVFPCLFLAFAFLSSAPERTKHEGLASLRMFLDSLIVMGAAAVLS